MELLEFLALAMTIIPNREYNPMKVTLLTEKNGSITLRGIQKSKVKILPIIVLCAHQCPNLIM